MKEWIKQLIEYEFYEDLHPEHRAANLSWLESMRDRYRREEINRVDHPRTEYPLGAWPHSYGGECQRCETPSILEAVPTGRGLRSLIKQGEPICRFLCAGCARQARTQRRKEVAA